MWGSDSGWDWVCLGLGVKGEQEENILNLRMERNRRGVVVEEAGRV